MRNYRYRGCSQYVTYRTFKNLLSRSQQISYRTFRNCVAAEELRTVFPQFTWGQGKGARLKDDPETHYYRSVYNGRPCVLARYQGMDYIFVQERNHAKV